MVDGLDWIGIGLGRGWLGLMGLDWNGWKKDRIDSWTDGWVDGLMDE